MAWGSIQGTAVTDAAYLHLSHVVKSYDGVTRAVDGISLDVERGEFVTFLGPSGSGKTTTLTLIAGFESPDEGTIRLAGRNLVELKPWQRNIGMVFQNYALFPHMTVAGNVAFPLRMRGVRKAEYDRKVGDVLDLVGLGAWATRYPRELSGGQQQRVALARGLVFRPDVLLLDEPLGALDKNLREQMQIEIRRIHREVGITMIYVTHDQDEAMTMSDRVAVFNGGRIEQIGAPLEIYKRPRTHFVAQFVGDSNLFEVAEIDPGAHRVSVPGLNAVSVAQFNSRPIGDRRWLLIRPEDIRLHGAQTAPALANRFIVHAKDVIHYGSDCLVIGQTHDGSTLLRVRLPRREAEKIAPGVQLEVGWEQEAGFVV
jgi:putative spermidine/putrescine transport system ATP-binding protein